MNKSLKVGLLDYTPSKYDRVYDARLSRDVVVAAFRESADKDVLVFHTYMRGLDENIPKNDFDAFVIMGNILSPIKPSYELDRVKQQIQEVISEKPVLGICFGHHIIAQLAGNQSKELNELIIGPTDVRLYEDIEDMGRAGDTVKLPMNQIYKITNANHSLKVLAISDSGIQIADATDHFGGNPVMGFQFHPEFAATDLGWRAFRNVYELTVERILSGDYPEFNLEPILKVLNSRVLRRLKKSTNPEYLRGSDITDKEKELLMSPFHNIVLSEKPLLGTSHSRRTHEELRQKSRAAIRFFVSRALQAKNRPKIKPLKPKNPKKVVKKPEQLKLFS